MDADRLAGKFWMVSVGMKARDQEHLREQEAFLREKAATIESAIAHFKTREQFLQVMGSPDDYKDPVAVEFIRGVLSRFAEVEDARRKQDQSGHGWLREGIPDGRNA